MKKYYAPEKIIQAYEECRRKLGRVPTSLEFGRDYPGALAAIRYKKRIPGVITWNGFLRYMGEEVNQDAERWSTPEKIVQAYEECRRKLGRAPTRDEFAEKYSGACLAIRAGKTIPNVNSWNGFVRYVGDKINNELGKWDSPERIVKAYEEYKKELGRTPTQKEFTERCGGAICRIMKGKIIPNVTNWNEFLRYIGEDINLDTQRWSTPEKIVQAYEECRRKLGRNPTQKEFETGSGGVILAIRSGKVTPHINRWSEFVVYMGDKPYRQRNNPIAILESLLNDENNPEEAEIK